MLYENHWKVPVLGKDLKKATIDLLPEVEKELAATGAIKWDRGVLSGGRQHYTHATYNKGCRGPLCRAAVRHEYRYKKLQEALGDTGTVSEEYSRKNRSFTLEEFALTRFIVGHLGAQMRELPMHLRYQMEICGLEIPLQSFTEPRQMIEAALRRASDNEKLLGSWVS